MLSAGVDYVLVIHHPSSTGGPVNLFLERLGSAGAPLLVAHRGASAHAPENTIAAARRAKLAGADAWEFDVRLTRDGVPVLLHDESLLRTTDVALRFHDDPRASIGFPVSQFDFEEVRSLDAGQWFVGDIRTGRSAFEFGTFNGLTTEDLDEFRSGAVRVPTLREALEFTVREDWLANVEIKSLPNRSPWLIEQVMAEIEAVGASTRILVSSFNHEDVALLGRWRPAIATGALLDEPVQVFPNYVREALSADCWHPSAGVLGAEGDRYQYVPVPETLRGELVAEFRSAGVPVLVYTVNDVRPGGIADHLATVGVSALFTDFPKEMRERWSVRESA